MFKVMVVDDDMIVRKGIMTSIAWSEYDIAFTLEARNGQEAWSKLQEHHVDLILTDIKMPVMSGIELAKKVRSECPDIEMVLLSGYEDFQYAKEAMAIGVRHYLLKPVLAEKLVSTLTGIREQLRSKRLAERGERYRNMLINEHMPLMRTKLMNELIGGKRVSDELLEKAITLHTPLTGPYYQVAVIEQDVPDDASQHAASEAEERKFFACMNIAEETLNGYYSGFLSLHKTGRMILLANLSDACSILEACKMIQGNLQRFLKLSVSIGVGEPVVGLGIATNRPSVRFPGRASREKAS
ncbi:YesN/AraC family two-component response regulator [Paenibacillus phyllosphaerae]|uniref:YesN/AraC family two-component response regulator n=1 Tax=Paenibacillus phyllosphaerae TaxID=274593 RepID=A0A7W5FRM6_9BACL|nr:response regulator [Paenibacillus phyllosphaerae]MBB3114686.1 YesN/AraC family two-component response regulator [Paenibacillus phyllosphaerae]